jgi:hypothetical protein
MLINCFPNWWRFIANMNRIWTKFGFPIDEAPAVIGRSNCFAAKQKIKISSEGLLSLVSTGFLIIGR